MDVVLRLDRGGRPPRRPSPIDRVVDGVAVERGLGRGEPLRTVADADHADMGVRRLAAVLVVEQRDAGQREIAAAAREFLEAPAPCRAATPADAPR